MRQRPLWAGRQQIDRRWAVALFSENQARADRISPTGGRIVLARHGETAWSRDGKHTGATDVPLTELGEEQARQLAGSLSGRDFGLVLVSPRVRATRTAELAGFGEYEIEPNLAEWDYGEYEGRTTDEISAQLGRTWNIWDAGHEGDPKLGEPLPEVGRRADAVIAHAMPTIASGRDALLVAHSHLLRVLAARWLNLPARDGALFLLSTGTFSELGHEHDNRVINVWNATS